MTEQLNENQQSFLDDLRANFKIEKSVETALYNTLVDVETTHLSNGEFFQVLRIFSNWVLEEDQKNMSGVWRRGVLLESVAVSITNLAVDIQETTSEVHIFDLAKEIYVLSLGERVPEGDEKSASGGDTSDTMH